MRMTCVLAAVLVVAAPGYSMQGKGKAKGRGHQEESAGRSSKLLDRGVIETYYRGNGGLPPGLAKRGGDLPPGLEKQLRKNGTLPPGLAKKIAPLPAAVEARLAPCPPEARRGIVAGVAVMYNSRTGLVIDAVVLAGM
jgi:hypothetical protein